MDEWTALEDEGRFDKILWGFGGPILGDTKVKIQRMPFITPEMTASPAHLMPHEVLHALDQWTWRKVASARKVRITDPEGTDLSYTNHDAYYDTNREFFAPDLIHHWFPQNEDYAKRPLGGHIWGKPWVFLDAAREDGAGVIAGTMNHIGPHPVHQDVGGGKCPSGTSKAVGDTATSCGKSNSGRRTCSFLAFPAEGYFTGGKLPSARTRRSTAHARIS